MIKKVFPHFRFDPPGGTVNKVAPQKTARRNNGHHPNHTQAQKQDALPIRFAGTDQIHRLGDKLGDDDLGCVHNDKAEEAQNIPDTVPGKVGQKGTEFTQRRCGHIFFLFRCISGRHYFLLAAISACFFSSASSLAAQVSRFFLTASISFRSPITVRTRIRPERKRTACLKSSI